MPSFPTNDSNGAILGKVGDWLRNTFISEADFASDVGASSSTIGGALHSRFIPWASNTVSVLNPKYGGIPVGGDHTAAIEAAWADANSASRALYFPPGRYNYNGVGLSGGAPNIHGAGRDMTRIHLGPSSRLIDTTGGLLTMDVGDFTLNGGIGLFRSTKTTNNVSGIYRVQNIMFKGYTGACIEHNSSDMPYWKFRDLIFDGANFTSTMGIALSGLTDGCTFEDIEFLRNRVHIKMRQGGCNAYIRNCDFIRFGAKEGFPRVDVWLVPRAESVNSGSGFTLSSCKFGSENMAAGDYRIAYADEAPGATNGERFPVLDAPSTGFISEHIISGIQLGGGTGTTAPLVYSTTANVRGCNYTNLTFGGSMPRYVIEFLEPTKVNPTAIHNILGPVFGAAIGVDGNPAPEASNAIGFGHLVDPNGVLTTVPGGVSNTESGTPASYASLARTPAQPYYAAGVTLESVTDSLGGTDARRVTTTGGGSMSVSIPDSTTSIVPGRPVWVEFDARAGSFTALRFRIEQSGGISHYQRVMRLSSSWHRFRFLWTPRVVPGAMHLNFIPFDSSAGTFEVGRLRVYHSQEPLNVDGLLVLDGRVVQLGLTLEGNLTATTF